MKFIDRHLTRRISTRPMEITTVLPLYGLCLVVVVVMKVIPFILISLGAATDLKIILYLGLSYLAYRITKE